MAPHGRGRGPAARQLEDALKLPEKLERVHQHTVELAEWCSSPSILSTVDLVAEELIGSGDYISGLEYFLRIQTIVATIVDKLKNTVWASGPEGRRQITDIAREMKRNAEPGDTSADHFLASVAQSGSGNRLQARAASPTVAGGAEDGVGTLAAAPNSVSEAAAAKKREAEVRRVELQRKREHEAKGMYLRSREKLLEIQDELLETRVHVKDLKLEVHARDALLEEKGAELHRLMRSRTEADRHLESVAGSTGSLQARIADLQTENQRLEYLLDYHTDRCHKITERYNRLRFEVRRQREANRAQIEGTREERIAAVSVEELQEEVRRKGELLAARNHSFVTTKRHQDMKIRDLTEKAQKLTDELEAAQARAVGSGSTDGQTSASPRGLAPERSVPLLPTHKESPPPQAHRRSVSSRAATGGAQGSHAHKRGSTPGHLYMAAAMRSTRRTKPSRSPSTSHAPIT